MPYTAGALYIDTVFANTGTVTTVPDGVQSNGSISFQQGWGPNYLLAKGSPGYLAVDNGTMNYLFNLITSVLQLYQQQTWTPWITHAENGGSAFTYGQFAVCQFTDGHVYESLVSSNNIDPINDGVNWQIIDASGAVTQPQIYTISASVAGNALTANFAGGALSFRSSSLTNGAVTSLTVSSSSITVPSGATLGTSNATQANLAVIIAYNGGSPVACIANMNGGLNLDESNLISPTTISGSSNASNVIYSASSVSAGSPYRVVGYVTITETAAGTWATAPTEVQGTGELSGIVPILNPVGITTVASSATVDLGSVSTKNVSITGTQSIASFGASAVRGQVWDIIFTGACTLNNSASLILPNGGSNISVAANDTCRAMAIGSGTFQVIEYQRVSGMPVSTAGLLKSANNLSDVSNLVTTLSNLGFGGGSGSGYITIPAPNGAIIVQWGTATFSGSGSQHTVNFPTTFPNSCAVVVLQGTPTATNLSTDTLYVINPPGQSSFVGYKGGAATELISYIAIGN